MTDPELQSAMLFGGITLATSVLGGPVNIAGGGTPGQPRSLRVYRHKSRVIQPALLEFLTQVADWAGMARQAMPHGLLATLHRVMERIGEEEEG